MLKQKVSFYFRRFPLDPISFNIIKIRACQMLQQSQNISSQEFFLSLSIIDLKVSLNAKYRFSLLRAGCACLARWRESRAFARASRDLDSDDFSMGLHIDDKGELVGEGGLA